MQPPAGNLASPNGWLTRLSPKTGAGLVQSIVWRTELPDKVRAPPAWASWLLIMRTRGSLSMGQLGVLGHGAGAFSDGAPKPQRGSWSAGKAEVLANTRQESTSALMPRLVWGTLAKRAEFRG